ncbi:MAG: acyl-CoA thioesterase [Thermodesulfobacteriota bacterium]
MKIHLVERRIMWGDLDALGIVFYPRYYEWMDASSHLFFESLGLTLGDLLRERGLTLGLHETSCRYHHPGRYHDLVQVRTSLAEVDSKTVLLRHLIVRMPDERTLVDGRERRICLDVRDPKRIRSLEIPKDIQDILSASTG